MSNDPTQSTDPAQQTKKKSYFKLAGNEEEENFRSRSQDSIEDTIDDDYYGVEVTNRRQQSEPAKL